MAIQHAPLTVREAIDKVLLLAEQLRTAVNLDRGTVLLLLSQARRAVMLKTLAFKRWAYIKTVDVVHKGVQGQAGGVPRHFIRPISVRLRPQGSGAEYREARLLDIREMYTVSTWFRPQTFNAATLENPVYWLWGPRDTVPQSSGLVFYAAPHDEWQSGADSYPDWPYYTGAALEGKMKCYVGPDDLVLETQLLGVPGEYERFLILEAMKLVLWRQNEVEKFGDTHRKSIKEQRELRKRFFRQGITERADLESQEDPVPASGQV